MSKWKRMLGKKWTFPAIYLIVAVLILATMWWIQDPNEYPLTKEELGLEEVNPISYDNSISDEELAEKLGEVITVTQAVHQMQWPVEDIQALEISKEFFDSDVAEEELENAIVTFQNEIWPHTGIDIVSSNGDTFTVVAALGGEVTRAEKDPVVGYIVELKHENGLVTSYSSIKDIQVNVKDIVVQGEILGQAGRNMFEKDQGIHLHFEVKQDGLAVNPNLFIGQDIELTE